jgi:hypothetical protein
MNVYSALWYPFPGNQGDLIQGDYNLYIDYKSPIKRSSAKEIFVQVEGPEIGECRDWLVNAKAAKYLDLILAWDEWILDAVPGAKLLPFGCPGWLTQEDYLVEHEKIFEISFLLAIKNTTVGHSIKRQLWSRLDEIIDVPIRSYVTADRYNGERFERLYRHNQYGIWFENHKYNNFFTERLIDCFLTKTIPIYYGCPNIGDYFDIDGIYTIDSSQDAIRVCNSLTPDTYNKKIEHVNRNYDLAVAFQENNTWFKMLNEYIGGIL